MSASASPCAEMRLFHATWDRNLIVPAQQYSKTLGGWYNSPESVVADVGNVRFVSAYVTVNPVKSGLWARAANKLIKLPKGGGSTDEDIASLSWLYIDIDSKRPSDVSATDEELHAATRKRDTVLDETEGLRSSSLWGCSGNGGWILTRLPDYPNDEHHRGLIAKALVLLAAKFNDDRVQIDVRTRNPARVMCLPGTLKCKGSDTPDRYYRLVTTEGVGWTNGHAEPFDLEGWIGGQGATIPVPSPPPLPGSATQRGAGRDFVVSRAREYITRFDPAVSGQGGHDQTFDVACALVIDFTLSIDEARPILREFNARCDPPWSEAELEHKLVDAEKKPGERGRLLKAGDEAWRAQKAAENLQAVFQPIVPDFDVKPDQEDNPHRLANLFMTTHGSFGGRRKLHFWFGEFWMWVDNCYRLVPEKEMRSRVSAFMASEYLGIYAKKWMEYGMGGEGKPPQLMKATARGVSDVCLAITSVCILTPEECPAQPSVMGSLKEMGWSAGDILATRNELINIREMIGGRLCRVPASPEFFSTSRLDYDLDLDAPEPTNWLTLLGARPVAEESPVQFQIWPDDAPSIEALQEWYGLHLLSDITFEKILALIGPKRSGKGTLASILTNLIGQANIAGPTLSSLGDKFGLEPLIGKRAAIIDDARIGPMTDQAVVTERLLSISGQGQLTVPRKFRSAWTGRISSKITLMSNEIPRLGDHAGALPGRFIILRMTRSVYGHEDNRLLDKIIPEMPGILKWSLEGLKRLYNRGRFVQPETGEEMVDDMGNLSSPVKAFLEDKCIISPGHAIRCDRIYTAWLDWCKDHGKREPGESQTFGRNLRSIIPSLRTVQASEGGRRVRKYEGLSLRPFDDDDDFIPPPPHATARDLPF